MKKPMKEFIEDCKRKGEVRQTKVYNTLSKLFENYPQYSVFNNQATRKGVDILVTKEGKPFLVVEVTNYSESSYMRWNRLYHYIKNLEYYNCQRILVLSYSSNLKCIHYNKQGLNRQLSDSERIRLAERLLAKHRINVSYFEYQD